MADTGDQVSVLSYTILKLFEYCNEEPHPSSKTCVYVCVCMCVCVCANANTLRKADRWR